MKVKVGDKVYDGEEQPIMVILTQDDKKNIDRMSPKATRYCCFPKGSDPDEIDEWMDDVIERSDKARATE